MTKSQTEFFCYLFIKQQTEAIVAFFILALTIILTIYAFKQLRQSIAILSSMENVVKTVYYIIFAWSLFFMAKVIFGEVLYWTEKNSENFYENWEKLSRKTKWVFGIDLIGGFLIQSILILIPFNWMDKILKFFEDFYQEDSVITSNGEPKPILKFEIILLKVLKIYLYIRPLFFFSIIITILSLSTTSSEIGTLGEIILFMLIIEGAFVIVILVMGYCGIKRNKKLAELVDPDDIDLMLNQYVLLIICSVLRLGLDTAFLAVHFSKMRDEVCGLFVELTSFWRWVRIVDMIVQALFTHFLPIFVTLRLFKIDESKINKSASLLANSVPDTSFTT